MFRLLLLRLLRSFGGAGAPAVVVPDSTVCLTGEGSLTVGLTGEGSITVALTGTSGDCQ